MTSSHALPTVLLPGWGFNPSVFGPWAAVLGGSTRALPLPIPEHGTQGVEAALQQTVACVLQTAPPKANWVGWSLGGMVALAVAAHAPERVAALTLVAATPRFTRSPDWPNAVEPAALRGFSDGIAVEPARTLQRFAALCARGSDDALKHGRALAGVLRDAAVPGCPALQTGLDMLAELDLRNLLPDIRPRLRWILGRKDPLVPVAVGAELRALRADIVILELAGAGHTPFLSHPQACAEFLLT